MRRFAISDIHGCLKSFQALLQKIDLQKSDHLYLLGDFINRGPDSKGVIDLIWFLQEGGYIIHCLRGNHEQMLIGAIDHPSSYDYGFPEFLKSFDIIVDSQLPQLYIDWVRALPYFFQVDQYILVHAGLSFETANPLTDFSEMLWIRYWYDAIDKSWLGDRIIIHGHTPVPKDQIIAQAKNWEQLPVLDIDAGCAHTREGMGFLCAFDLDSHQLFFQERLDDLSQGRSKAVS